MKFDYIFVDLDDTLFQTCRFKEDIFKIFYSYGVSRDDCAATYKQAVFGPMEGYFCYTFQKHADLIREKGYQIPDETVNRLNGLLDNNYLETDTEFFLSGLKKLGGQLVLQTAGEKHLQQKKIDVADLTKYFDRVDIIDGGKIEHILSVAHQARAVLFINDNLQENVKIKVELPDVLVIAKQHKILWAGDDYSRYPLPYFETLTEILNYVSELK